MKPHLLKGLFLGLVIFITLEIIAPIIELDDKAITLNSILRGLVAWTLGGLIYGCLDYIFRPKRLEKQ